MAKVTWRIDDELLEQLQRAWHARPAGEMKLSFNAWIIAQLRSLFPPKRRRR